MCLDSSDGGAAAEARQQEAARDAKIASGMADINSSFGKFDDAYYQNYQNKVIAQGAPDINSQYKDASNQAAFTFGSSNPGGSSASADAFGRLKTQQGQSLQNLNDTAANDANSLRSNVANQRSSIVNELNATADPFAASQEADNQVAALSAAPTYSPVAGLFSNLTAQFANAQAASRASLPGAGFQIGSGAGSSTSPTARGSIAYTS